MSERTRTEPSALEQRRAHPSRQLLLNIGAVEQSDGAYLSALEDCQLADGVRRVVEWLILDGRREAGQKRLPCRTQRQLATRLGMSPSTVCGALRKLQESGLVVQQEGEYRLDLQLLVAMSEEAVSRREVERPAADAAAALDGLARARSACSGALGKVDTCSSKEESKTRVHVTRAVSRGASSAGEQLSAMPWAKVGGVSGEQLREAVRDRDEVLLTGLYWAGCEKEWWADCEAYRVTFLACCWQAVESAERSPMGLLQHLVRKFLRPAADGERRRGLTGGADDWAAETRKVWNRRRAEEAEANCGRHLATSGIPAVG